MPMPCPTVNRRFHPGILLIAPRDSLAAFAATLRLGPDHSATALSALPATMRVELYTYLYLKYFIPVYALIGETCFPCPAKPCKA
ncbi:MAG: hypothetical protein KDJ29_10900 [Hyphomicrobiales bacterium]|nr:hypothetical protein [Hyphomicrobiales bacterium]